MMFLIDMFRKTKQVERDIDRVEADLNKFFEKIETKTKFIIQKDIEKMKKNFLTCSDKLHDFFQAYYGTALTPVFNKGALEKCLRELEGVKRGIRHDEGREEYFRVSQKYRSLQKHRQHMSCAQSKQTAFDFGEIEKHADLLRQKNDFFNNYLQHGRRRLIESFSGSRRPSSSCWASSRCGASNERVF